MIHIILFVVKLVFAMVYTILALNILNVFLLQWGTVKPRGTYTKMLKSLTEPLLKPFTQIARQFPGSFFVIETRIVMAYIFFSVINFVLVQVFGLFSF